MTSTGVALILMAVLAAGLALWRIGSVRKLHADRVRRLRATELYGHLYPLMCRCERMCVERVVMRSEAMTIRVFLPRREVMTYTFEQHGFDPLPPDTLYALAQAAVVDMPALRRPGHYHFAAHTERKPNGTRVRWYDYTIAVGVKDELLRGAYLGNAPRQEDEKAV